MKQRQKLKKQPQTDSTLMSHENIKICISNQEGYDTLYLNDSLHFLYYNFVNIDNLELFLKPKNENQTQEQTDKCLQQIQGVNTLFLNNNLIQKIQNLSPLSKSLVTLNLSHNKISKVQGLKDLVNLVVLDLSYNKIKVVQENQIKTLNKLNRLNLAGNLLTSKQSIQAIICLNESLESLDLSFNNSFSPEADQLLSQVFAKMNKIKVLNLAETPFVRMTSAYRKKIILVIHSLTFLNDRPVTQDQRSLAKAWSIGGIKAQNQARKQIRLDRLQKNRKIIGDIEQRQKIVDQKVQKLFLLRAKKQLIELEKLTEFTKTQDFSMLTTQQQSLIRLKIDELERYLLLLKQHCRQLDLDKQLGLNEGSKLPKMLIENRTSECIFVYNVDESLIDELKSKYYPEQTLPIKIVNYEKPKQIEWLSEYDDILQKTYNLCKGNWQMIVPAFNLDIYDFDESCGRGIRRFQQPQLRKKFGQLKSKKSQQQTTSNGDRNYVHTNQSTIKTNQLDCLD